MVKYERKKREDKPIIIVKITKIVVSEEKVKI